MNTTFQMGLKRFHHQQQQESAASSMFVASKDRRVASDLTRSNGKPSQNALLDAPKPVHGHQRASLVPSDAPQPVPRLDPTPSSSLEIRDMCCEMRMKRLKSQLFAAPIDDPPLPPAEAKNVADADHQHQQSIDLEHVRSLVFYGIHEDFVAKKRKRIRPLAWRLLLGVLGPDASEWKTMLNTQRSHYRNHKKQFLYRQSSRPLDQIALLGTEDESLLQEQAVRQDVALIRDIEKDVSRTQSSISFFELGGIAQKWMLSILFVYAKLNPDVGYVQGMNEILAPLVYTFGTDPCKEWSFQAEADVFVAFASIMKSAKLLFMKSPHDTNKMGVDHQMERLELLLRQHDAVLWQHLNSIGLNASFYSFKWYMTLLAREFPMDKTLRIWDALLADPRRFGFLHYVNCALLKSQRRCLLDMDFCTALKHLQTLPAQIEVETVLADAEQMRTKDRTVDDQRRRSIG